MGAGSKAIAKLSVLIGCDPKAAEKGLDRLRRTVRSWARDFNKAGDVLLNKFTGLAAVAGAGLTAHGLKETAEAIDRTAKGADRLGITTEALIGLRHGANLAGMGVEEFDAALTTMTSNVGLAAMGQGKAGKALDELGFNFEALAKLDPEAQFKVIGDALSKVENPARRLALATRIFGDQGAAMINVVQGGIPAIEAMQREAEALGLTFSRVDAAKVEAANDALTRVSEVILGIGQDIVIALAPYVEAAANAFTDWATKGRSWGDIVVGAVEWVAAGIAKLFDLLDYGKIAWEMFKIAGAYALKGLLMPIHLLVQGITKLVDLAADYLPQSLVDASNQAKAFNQGLFSGLDDQIAGAKKKIRDIWTGPSSADAVAKYFADVRAKAKAAAEAATKDAPQSSTIVNDRTAKGKNPEKETKQPASKAERVNFSGNAAIRAGSAEAQASTSRSAFDAMTRKLERQIALQREQIRELEGIKNAIEEEDAAVVGIH
jgi:hypothetical protein